MFANFVSAHFKIWYSIIQSTLCQHKEIHSAATKDVVKVFPIFTKLGHCKTLCKYQSYQNQNQSLLKFPWFSIHVKKDEIKLDKSGVFVIRKRPYCFNVLELVLDSFLYVKIYSFCYVTIRPESKCSNIGIFLMSWANFDTNFKKCAQNSKMVGNLLKLSANCFMAIETFF